MGFFDTLFGGGAQEEAAAKNAAALQTYQNTALPALATGYNTGTGAINSAISAYSPLATLGAKYNQAGDLLSGALGAGGPAGTAAAQAAFTNAPGYSDAITAGLDAINRRRGTTGMYDSGNADQDAQTFGQNLQNQQYNTWLQNLQSLAGMGVTATGGAATGQAAGYGSLANLATQYGEDQSGVASGVTSGTIADNNMVASGQAAGAKNILGAGLSLASLAMAPLTGGSSLAGLALKSGSNLLFGGGSPSSYGA